MTPEAGVAADACVVGSADVQPKTACPLIDPAHGSAAVPKIDASTFETKSVWQLPDAARHLCTGPLHKFDRDTCAMRHNIEQLSSFL